VKLGFQRELHEWEKAELDISAIELAGENGINTTRQTIKSSPETPACLLTNFT
jgi:hypothetical protein